MQGIIFIIETPLLERDAKRFELHRLRAMCEVVRVFELSHLLQPYASHNVKEGRCNYDEENVKIFKSWQEFEKTLSCLTNFNYVVKLGNGPYTYKLYKIFKKYNIRYALLLPEIVPTAAGEQKKGHFFNYLRKLKSNPLRSLYGSFYKRIINYLNIQPANTVFYSGDGGRELDNVISNYRTDKNTRYKSLASIAFLECEKVKKQIENDKIGEDFILFIDQGLPVHPDLISLGRIVPADVYYQQINWFLNTLSEYYVAKVVVALHPRVNYEKNPFDAKFECIKGQTPRLVKSSKLVVYHFSESLNYIVFFKKPVIPITLDCLEAYYGYTIRIKVKSIAAPVYNISKYYSRKRIPENLDYFNEESYHDYMRSFMPGTFDYPSVAEAICDFAKQLNERC